MNVVVEGPSGAGKTTWCRRHLPAFVPVYTPTGSEFDGVPVAPSHLTITMRSRKEHSTMSTQALNRLHMHASVAKQDFAGQDLTMVRPRQLWFSYCSFVGADFRHARLDGCHFKFCDFRGANLRAASLRGVGFAGCDLRAADLSGSDLTGSRLSAVNTGMPPYGRTDVTDAIFAGAMLRDLECIQVIGWSGQSTS